jgi:hypothetical protein
MVRVDDLFPDVPCDLCTKLAQLNTVPLRLIPAGCPPGRRCAKTVFAKSLAASHGGA